MGGRRRREGKAEEGGQNERLGGVDTKQGKQRRGKEMNTERR